MAFKNWEGGGGVKSRKSKSEKSHNCTAGLGVGGVIGLLSPKKKQFFDIPKGHF